MGGGAVGPPEMGDRRWKMGMLDRNAGLENGDCSLGGDFG
jgi:hypothetical protein